MDDIHGAMTDFGRRFLPFSLRSTAMLVALASTSAAGRLAGRLSIQAAKEVRANSVAHEKTK